MWRPSRIADFIRLLFVADNRKDESDGLRLMSEVARFALPQYRFTYPQIDWWKNDGFNAYLKKFDEQRGFNTHRRWMLGQLLRMTDAVEGDTAECGVYRGAGSWLILEANTRAAHRKVHHIFDSFEGLSHPEPLDGDHWTHGDLAVAMPTVEKYLRPYVNGTDYKMYKGWIPDRYAEVSHLNFGFVHIDVDLYQPTYDSAHFFYPRMKAGAILVCDDYGFSTCPGATKAMDTFLSDKVEKMLYLPDGGGFFIKGMSVK